jgi:RecB family exonuclease
MEVGMREDQGGAGAAPAAPEPAAPALALSHSQIEVFQQCPRRWWLLKRAEVRRAPSEPLILGQAVHQAIEADLRGRLAGEAPAGLPRLEAALAEGLAERLAQDDPDGLVDAPRRRGLEANGRAVLSAYVAQVSAHLNPVAVERSFEFQHPDDATITFAGRMDAVTSPTQGTQTRTIVDWKIIGRPWPPGEEHVRPQATAYIWAEQRMGWEPSGRVTFVTFPPRSTPDAAATPPRTVDWRPTRRSPDDLRAYARGVRQVADGIRAMEAGRTFPPRTSRLCAWCEVRGACPAGQAYLRDRGMAARVPVVPLEADAIPTP